MERIYGNWIWSRFLRTFVYSTAVMLTICFVGVSIAAQRIPQQQDKFAQPLTGRDLVEAIENKKLLSNHPEERVDRILSMAKRIGDKPVVDMMSHVKPEDAE